MEDGRWSAYSSSLSCESVSPRWLYRRRRRELALSSTPSPAGQPLSADRFARTRNSSMRPLLFHPDPVLILRDPRGRRLHPGDPRFPLRGARISSTASSWASCRSSTGIFPLGGRGGKARRRRNEAAGICPPAKLTVDTKGKPAELCPFAARKGRLTLTRVPFVTQEQAALPEVLERSQ